MSKAEKFISDCTKHCSNEIGGWNNGVFSLLYTPWLSPEQALKAVEIAKAEVREQMMKDAIETSVCAMLDGIHIDILPKQLKGYRFGDKVKVLIIKDE